MNRPWPQWLQHLSDEDLAFTRRFVLNSGSLKALATDYRVSYPTIRLRLDGTGQTAQSQQSAQKCISQHAHPPQG